MDSLDALGPSDFLEEMDSFENLDSIDAPDSDDAVDLRDSLDSPAHDHPDFSDLLVVLDSNRSKRSKRHKQDWGLLKNTYKAMAGVRGDLKRNRKLEEMAQSTRICKVCDHAHHKDIDNKVLRAFGKMAANIACTGLERTICKTTCQPSCKKTCKTTKTKCGGCREGVAFTSKDPLAGWRKSTKGHWENITGQTSPRYTKVGCAANRCRGSSSSAYLWCYFA